MTFLCVFAQEPSVIAKMSSTHCSHHHHYSRLTSPAAVSKLNLLVRYLDHAVDDDQLHRFFASFGTITSSIVMRDILTGESRGFGFVRFACHSDAAKAMAEADGKRIGGKAVNIFWAKQQHDMVPAGQDRLKVNKLFLRNVPLDVTEKDLVDLVSCHGPVTEVSLHNDRLSAACHAPSRRIAFIVFSTEGAAEAALRAVHNTRPFPSCRDIPLMAKLSEDYTGKPSSRATSASANVHRGVGCSCSVAPQRPCVSAMKARDGGAASMHLFSEVVTVPSLFKFAEHSACHVSTPISTTACSPGISSLVQSLESVSLDTCAASAMQQMSAKELDSSLPSSCFAVRTPMRRVSTVGTTYRHNPYVHTQMMVPSTLASSLLTTPSFSDSPRAQCAPPRG